MLVIAGTITVAPADRDAAIAAALAISSPTREEPGCISYGFSADLLDPAKFRLFEEWRSQEDLDLHFATPHMADFLDALGAIQVTESTITKYKITSHGPL